MNSDDVIEECEHDWVTYSRPPTRAVTGHQCTKCKVIIEPIADRAKLKRYEEREPLVQALIQEVMVDDLTIKLLGDEASRKLFDAASKVDGFKLT